VPSPSGAFAPDARAFMLALLPLLGLLGACGVLIGVDDLSPRHVNDDGGPDSSGLARQDGAADAGGREVPHDASDAANGARVAIVAVGERRMRSISFDNGSTWTDGDAPESDGGAADSLTASAIGNGTFVGLSGARYVGVSAVLTTRDGVTWSAPPALVGDTHSVVFAQGRFLAGTDGDVIFTSNDGQSWTKTATSGEFRTLAFWNGRYVAGGIGRLWSSLDGLSWTATNIPAAANEVFCGAASDAGGTFVFLTTGHSVVTRDGAVVDFVASLPSLYRKVAFGNGRWVTTDGLGSTDGRTWAPIHAVPMTAIAFGAGAFFATNDHDIYRSSNGAAWVTVHTVVSPGVGGLNAISIGAL